ncbi:cell division control protein 14, SIN component-domain-containing protein [Pholiota molesta]|nr:cell division control protein 14, SIN component-domain-containing protein [Pholiota molesta]
MALEDAMSSMRASLQAALDELASPRSSSKDKHKALQSIERSLAAALFNTQNNSEARDCFVALQYTFECNVPSHLLSWMIKTTSRLEAITNRGSMDVEQGSEAEELAAQLALCLSLIQGIVLNHEASKVYLGRKPALETLLDLLLASRHISSPQEASESKSRPASGSPHLTSIILDTLLCVLVDSPTALRVFEEASGVQGVVKILKRAGTPREVRMKCLEFLYFYLLDETPTSPTALTPTDLVSDRIVSQSTPPPTAPATPIRPPKPYLSSGPKHPTSRYGSSTYLFASRSGSAASLSLSASSAPSSRSTSGSSTKSFSSTSSNASSPTPASSLASSPVKESSVKASPAKEEASPTKESPLSAGAGGKTPARRLATPSNQLQRTPPATPAAPPFSSAARFPQMRTLMLLRKDVEYVPQSPKKLPPPPTGLERRPTHQKSLSSSGSLIPRTSALGHARVRSQATLVGSSVEEMGGTRPAGKEGRGRHTHEGGRDAAAAAAARWKTTEEKKELLGTMLGNVDALVEGVRKAGIWGLG